MIVFTRPFVPRPTTTGPLLVRSPSRSWHYRRGHALGEEPDSVAEQLGQRSTSRAPSCALEHGILRPHRFAALEPKPCQTAEQAGPLFVVALDSPAP